MGSPFVAGQLIVKLAGSSAGGEAVTRALGGSELHEDPDLAAYLAELSAEIGTPLEAMRLTSGSEVVLAVDRERLVADVSKRLREDERVERAVEYESSERKPFTRPSVEWRVELGDELAGRISETQRLEETVAELEKSLGYELTGQVDGESAVVLTLDLSTLTEKLRARLAERPDVEYVELDRMMQHY